jgi:hypothetical protein
MANDQNVMPDVYDRLLGQLHGLPDTINTKMSSLRVVVPMVGDSRSFSVQTYRQKEWGDTIFVECTSKDGVVRIALPPEVADTIARQRDQLTARNRSKTAKATALARKEAGILPGFMRKGRAAK